MGSKKAYYCGGCDASMSEEQRYCSKCGRASESLYRWRETTVKESEPQTKEVRCRDCSGGTCYTNKGSQPYKCSTCDGTGIVTERRGSGCHITKVVVYGMGKTDDCPELTALRHFRDTYLEPRFTEEVTAYYAESVALARRIGEEAARIPGYLQKLYDEHIAPAVAAITSGDMTEAHRILRAYLAFARSLVKRID